LDELPETLDETYERNLRDINKANWESAYNLLRCVAVAFRPLRVAELAEILSFDFKTGSIPKFHEDLRLEDPVDAVLSTTSSLLAIVDVEGSPVIQFSHFSVKEFLTSTRLAETNDIISRRYHISMTPAHTLMAQACLGILLHLDKNAVDRESLKEYPLVEYAAKHWVGHARFEGVSGNVEDGMKLLFDPSKSHLAVLLWIHDPARPSWGTPVRGERPLQPRGSHLHYAALYGLHAIVEFLVVQYSQDIHSRYFNEEEAPLHLASQRGHEDVARLLIEHGADATAQSKYGTTPLHGASREEVARLLLEHGADATAQTSDGSTPLHHASRKRHDDVSRLLLKHGADATARATDGSTPLHWVWSEEVARLLLEHGADATARTKHGSTPLHSASERGLEEVARLLLDRGADATAETKAGISPLFLARSEEVAHLLLEHGADATARTDNGATPLLLVSERGREQVARLLLEHGVDATAKTKDGITSLHWASEGGHEGVVRLLLKHGADATARTDNGATPLHMASEWGHDNVVRLLLEHGADATAQTVDGSTPLHLVWSEEVARLLLEHGADAAAKTKDGLTPLDVASRRKYGDIARLLLEHGADSTAQENAKDSDGA
jgi:ankyrin repeat protein